MSTARRQSRPAIPLRKTAQLRRVSPPLIDLGVLNERLGYFVRRVQVWVFQDFILCVSPLLTSVRRNFPSWS